MFPIYGWHVNVLIHNSGIETMAAKVQGNSKALMPFERTAMFQKQWLGSGVRYEYFWLGFEVGLSKSGCSFKDFLNVLI